MTTRTQARDQLIGAFRTAWLANPTSAPFPLEYDDVYSSTSAAPTTPLQRTPFGRISVRTAAGEQETLGALDGRRFKNTCLFGLQLFTAPGDGNKKADELSGIAVRILRRLRDPAGVWGIGDVTASEIGVDEDTGMFQTNVVGTFNYEERA